MKKLYKLSRPQGKIEDVKGHKSAIFSAIIELVQTPTFFVILFLFVGSVVILFWFVGSVVILFLFAGSVIVLFLLVGYVVILILFACLLYLWLYYSCFRVCGYFIMSPLCTQTWGHVAFTSVCSVLSVAFCEPVCPIHF